MHSLFHFRSRALTPLTDELAVGTTLKVVPFSTVPPNSHHTVLLGRCVVGSVGPPKAEGGAVSVGPPPGVFQESDPRGVPREGCPHGAVLRCRLDADQLPGQPPAVVLRLTPRLHVGHKYRAVRVVTYKQFDSVVNMQVLNCLFTYTVMLAKQGGTYRHKRSLS